MEINGVDIMKYVVWGLVGVGGLVLIGILSAMANTACPACKKWLARKKTGSQELARKEGYKTVTREDVTRNTRGEVIGKTERQEQVHMTMVSLEHAWLCKKCNHTWFTTEIKEVGG